MLDLEENHLVEKIFEIYSPYSHHSTGYTLDEINIKDEIYCEETDETFTVNPDNIKVKFKVIVWLKKRMNLYQECGNSRNRILLYGVLWDRSILLKKKKIEASPRFLNNNLDTILYYLECTIFILEPKGILASLF